MCIILKISLFYHVSMLNPIDNPPWLIQKYECDSNDKVCLVARPPYLALSTASSLPVEPINSHE